MKSFLFMLGMILSLNLACTSIVEKIGGSDSVSDEEQVDQQGSNVNDQQPRPETKWLLYLGPGYLKSFAHVGFLNEISKEGWEPDFIMASGLSSVMAGAYARNSKAGDLEWQLSKLPSSALEKSSWFGKKQKSIQDWSEILEKLFSRYKSTSDFKLPFACEAVNEFEYGNRLFEDGSSIDNIKRCSSESPFMTSYKGWQSAKVGRYAKIKELKDLGIRVVYVSVLDAQDFKKNKNNLGSSGEQYLMALQISEEKKISQLVDFYVSVGTSGMRLDDSSSKRKLISKGQRSAKDFLNQFTELD
ncbi:MAG: hypothetical protein AB8E15_07460 [Bdellovibrionales bacterium]